MKNIALFIIACLSIASCNTLNSVVKAKQEGKGTTHTYEVDKDQAWMIAKKTFRWGGTDAIEEYREEGYMLTSSGMNLVSSGAVMGAWVEPIDANKTKVTVVTKRRIATQLATTLTETRFHKLYNAAVEIVKRGDTLPLEAPDVN